MSTTDAPSEERRDQAVKRLQKRYEFWTHLAAYVLVNAMLVAIWLAASGGGFFWPLFPLFGWGIGLFFHGMDVFRRPWSDERIRREMDRMP